MNESAFPNNRFNGMDLRDYFAARAMKMFSYPQHFKEEQPWFGFFEEYTKLVCKASYLIADGMMEARKQAPNEIKE
jgi:hypothetical protein